MIKVPHSRDNRARHQLAVEPDFSGEPTLFISVLRDAFYDPRNEAAADEQLRLIRQLFGAAILGHHTNLQRAVFLHGAAGSGKSLTLRVLECLFNPADVTVVSPHEMDQDYKKATLAHKRLNIVPELDADKPIPSAAFKAALGEDRLNARLPYHVPFTFKCEAACWFNGNMKPMTRDHGDAFYRRWIIINFRNSKPESERVPGLFDAIISTELGKIAGWAIEGARDLLANGLKLTAAHNEELASWREEASSVASWLADHPADSGVAPRTPSDETHSYKRPILRSDAYKCYKSWSITVGRHPLSKTHWSMEMNRLGHTPTKSRGDFVFTTLWESDREPSPF